MTLSLNSDKTIRIPYNGIRSSYQVFHPIKQQNLNTRWLEVKAEFMRQLTTWEEVCELYHDDMVLSEKVTTKQLAKEIRKVLGEIEDYHKTNAEYMVEALAEALWDKPNHDEADIDHVGNKVERHELPAMKDLARRADELKMEDLGLKTSDPSLLITKPVRHTWSG